MQMMTPTAPDTDQSLLATTDDYREAQRMVDTLSDEDFPVEELAIVWEGLRQVEHVTGRVTTTTAAGRGAVAGAWFGGLFGLLFAMFSTQGFAVFLTYLVVGALAGAVWRGGSHALQRGRRDFGTIGTVAAREYQVWCPRSWAGEAAQLLGIRRPSEARTPEAQPPGAPPSEAQSSETRPSTSGEDLSGS